MKLRIALCLAGSLAVVWGGEARAAVAYFAFDNPGGLLAHTDVQGQTFAPISGSPLFEATVYGGKVGQPPNGNARAYLVDFGLGVQDTSAPNGDRDSYLKRVMVDGTFGAEYIRLVFNEPVQVTKAKFFGAGAFERFGLAVDGVTVDVKSILGSDVITALAPSRTYTNTVNFPVNKLPFGTVWDFIAPTAADSWLLENVEVIPEPATLLVWSALCLGACGLPGVRRRISG